MCFTLVVCFYNWLERNALAPGSRAGTAHYLKGWERVLWPKCLWNVAIILYIMCQTQGPRAEFGPSGHIMLPPLTPPASVAPPFISASRHVSAVSSREDRFPPPDPVLLHAAAAPPHLQKPWSSSRHCTLCYPALPRQHHKRGALCCKGEWGGFLTSDVRGVGCSGH